MEHFDAYINFSGGIDSTACVYRYLKENPDKRLLIHHCEIKKRKEREHRAHYEMYAVFEILNWLHLNGLTNYKSITTRHDTLESDSTINDSHIVAFNTCIIFRSQSFKFQDLIICASKDDFEGANYENRRMRREKLYEIYCPNLKFHYPIKNETRAEIIASLPSQLLDLTFFCQGTNRDHYPCRQCYVCKQTMRHLYE